MASRQVKQAYCAQAHFLHLTFLRRGLKEYKRLFIPWEGKAVFIRKECWFAEYFVIPWVFFLWYGISAWMWIRSGPGKHEAFREGNKRKSSGIFRINAPSFVIYYDFIELCAAFFEIELWSISFDLFVRPNLRLRLW